MLKTIPARFSKDAIIPVASETMANATPAPVPTPVEVVEQPTAKIVMAPEPPKPVQVNTVESKKENFLLIGGKYKILARPDSGYRIIYRILSEKCNFAAAEQYLQTHDISTEQEAKELLELMLVDANVLEELVRNDPDWSLHCQARLDRLKNRVTKGDKSAEKTLSNGGRIKDGTWNGNIREMFSVCNGSSSEKATNRNIKKFKDAGLMFMMFPRRVKEGQPVHVTMFPAQYKDKVNAAKSMVFKTLQEN